MFSVPNIIRIDKKKSIQNILKLVVFSIVSFNRYIEGYMESECDYQGYINV